jgi:Tfp pilus assembly protein PilV
MNPRHWPPEEAQDMLEQLIALAVIVVGVIGLCLVDPKRAQRNTRL